MMRELQDGRRVPFFVGSLALVLILWWHLHEDGAKQAEPRARERLAPRALEAPLTVAASAPSAPTAPKVRAAGTIHVDDATEDTDADGTGPGDPAHPIDAERMQLQRELQLIGALNDAFDLQDVSSMRRLIEQYRATQPDDVHRLQEGYERLADCLASPGEASRAKAQRYYDEARASTLRRYIRRACLEPE
jgi:hypothetical protein